MPNSLDTMVDEDALEISLDRETFERVYEVRTVLGVGVARYAATKAKKEDIKALEKAVELLERPPSGKILLTSIWLSRRMRHFT